VRPLRGGPLPYVSDDVEQQDNGESKVRLEKGGRDIARVGRCAANGRNGDIELCDEHQNDEDQPHPGAPDAKHGTEGEFLDRVALDSPCFSETDVAEADGTPGEERRETAKRDKPIEDEGPARSEVDVCQRPKEEHEDERPKRSARFVDVGE